MKKFWRRREPPPRRPSDLTPTSGRFWSPDSWWNQPLTPHEPSFSPEALRLPLAREVVLSIVATAPVVLFGSPNDRMEVVHERLGDEDVETMPNGFGIRIPRGAVPPRPEGTMIVVDQVQRRVVCGTRWHWSGVLWSCEALGGHDLDGNGWGSLAAGLVLEREIITGRIEHALALEHPDPTLYGRTVRIAPEHEIKDERAGYIGTLVGRALQTYGGYIVGTTDEPVLVVRCQRSVTSSGLGVGHSYQGLGIGRDRHPLRFPMDLIDLD